MLADALCSWAGLEQTRRQLAMMEIADRLTENPFCVQGEMRYGELLLLLVCG